jgi:hypothetical protein
MWLQWFSCQIMTYTRIHEHEAHISTVCLVCQLFVAEGITSTGKDFVYSGLCRIQHKWDVVAVKLRAG